MLWHVVLPLVSTLPAWFLMPPGWLPWRGTPVTPHARRIAQTLSHESVVDEPAAGFREEPGLGVEPDPAIIEKYLVRD